MMAAISDYSLTIVEAPMGYGKTTAVKELLNKSRVNVQWQQIENDDKNEFWKGFCALIVSLNEEIGEGLIQLGFPKDSVSVQESFRIMKDLNLDETTILVLDDYHLVHDKEVDQFLQFLVTEELEYLHIVLITRFIKFINMEELQLKGYLHYITKENFVLIPDGIKKYYKLCGISLTDSDADKLFAYTEGWIGALYLLLIHYNNDGIFEKADNIYKLVKKTIYDPFSDEIKEFLLKMSLFDSFTLDQANHMWQKDNARELLEEIMNKNALVKYDLQNKTYQFHNIFTKFLREEFEKKTEEYKKQLTLHSAQWYVKQGDFLAAMNGFYRADEFDLLLNVVEADKGHCIHNEQKDIFINYFENCPDVLARAFKLSNTNMAVLDQFDDKDSISKWAQSSVAALVSAGYINGSNGQIQPKQNMTRAEFAQIMANLVDTYIQKSGTYTTNINGNLMVNTPDVILKDITITGNLIVGDGVGNGEVTLNNVVVKGTTIIRGGGIHSIKIIGNSSIHNIIIARVNGEVRVYAEDGTQVGDVVVDGKDDVIVEGKVGVVTVAASDITVNANNAKIEAASIDGNNSKIVLNTNTSVKIITLNAQNSEVVAEKGAEIKKVVANEDGAKISGTGTVGEVNANANNITVKTNGTSVAAGQGTTGVVAGTTNVASGTTTKVSTGTSTQTATGGSSGGSGSSIVAVTAITVNGTGGAISLVNGETLQMKATIMPANATNQTIVWTVVNGTGVATIDSNGLLTATGAGTVIIKATNTTSNVVGQLTVTIEPTLAEAKTKAKVALNAAFNLYTITDYTTENWNTVLTAKGNGDTAIDAAADTAGVNNAKIAAINAMGAVKTIAGTLADAKTKAKADLAASLATYTETDYVAANWTTLTIAKTSGDTAIEVAADLAEVTSAKTDAINAMDAVKTIAETNAEAEAAVVAEINGANASDMEAVLVSNAAILGLDMTDYNALSENSSVITAMVALNSASKATILSTFNNAVAAQKTAEALAAAEAAAVLAINGADTSSMNGVLQSNAATIGLDLTDYSALLDKSSVITVMVALNGADKTTILSAFNSAVATQKTAEALAAAKTAAKAALSTALSGYLESDYTPVNWTALTTAKTNGDTAIEAATDVAGVNNAKLAAINAMDAVKTIAETLAEAKTTAKADLTAALGTYAETDYTSANWAALTTAKASGDTAIDTATDVAGVSSAKTAAINAMGAIKTNAQIAAEVEAAAVAAINGADAAGMDDAIKANATTLGLDLTDYSALLDNSSVITAMVALNGADKSTVVSTFNSAVDAQKTLETTVTSKNISNFNYETIYAEQARLNSKTISSVNFASNPKQFTVSDGTHTININLNWDIPLSGFTTGQMMGSAVDSFIQDYCNANHIDLGNRTMGSVGYGDTFSIYTFSTGSSAKITLGGSNWSDFFTLSQSTGKNDDFSANRSFIISDGINSTNIKLEWDDADMDGLISDINSQMGSVLARAEKVSESQFKIVAKTGAHTITISGTDKDEFF